MFRGSGCKEKVFYNFPFVLLLYLTLSSLTSLTLLTPLPSYLWLCTSLLCYHVFPCAKKQPRYPQQRVREQRSGDQLKRRFRPQPQQQQQQQQPLPSEQPQPQHARTHRGSDRGPDGVVHSATPWSRSQLVRHFNASQQSRWLQCRLVKMGTRVNEFI